MFHVYEYEAVGSFVYGGLVDLHGEPRYGTQLHETFHPIVDGGVEGAQCFADVHEGRASVFPEIMHDSPVGFIQLQTQRLSSNL